MRAREAASAGELRAVLSLEGRFLAVSDAWTAVLGWSPEELQGSSVLDLLHPDDRPAARHEARQLSAGRPSVAYTTRLRHRGGGFRWLRWDGVPSVAQGRVFALVRDITEESVRLGHLEDLIELSAEAIVEVDAHGLITYCNERLGVLVGCPSAELFARPLTDLLVAEDAAARRLLQGQLLDPAPQIRRFTARIDGADGRRRWVQVAARPRFDADGALVSLTTVLTDITALHLRQRELDELNAHLLELQDHLDVAHELSRLGHWHADLPSGTLVWSPVIFEIFGLDPDEVQPDTQLFYDAVHPEDLPQVLASQERSMTTGLHDVVHRIVRPDGSIGVVHERARSVLGADGTLQELVGTVQDVTDLVAAQDAHARSEDRLRRVLEATRDGWWDLDVRSGEAFYSERWWELHGLSPDAVAVDIDTWRRFLDPEDRSRLELEVAAARERVEPTLTFTGRALHASGRTFPVRIRALLEYDADGVAIRASGATSDISREQRAELLQDEFIATVSHELRTPLTGIGGALEVLTSRLSDTLPVREQQLLGIAVRSTDRLRRLIDDLLDVDRLLHGPAGAPGRALVRLSLADLVRQAGEDHLVLARERGLVLDWSDSTDAALVSVDADRIQQVLANYLSNALKYAPPGSAIELRVIVAEAMARAEVIDDGPGLPAGFEDRAFDRFAQGDPVDPRSRGGTGLGLAISRELVHRFGGRVGYERRGERTCFWFELPLDLTSTAPGADG